MATSPPSAAAAAAVTKNQIASAVTALLNHKSKQPSEKLQLLPQDDFLYLNITLKKIPTKTRTKPFLISLPNPIFDPSSAQLCLIIDDREKTPTPSSDEIKKLIKSQNIAISKVIRLSKLKNNYKAFEAKRKLCDSYDLFLVDKRVVHLLPKLIGKDFFRKKKLPLGVDFGKNNLKKQVESVLDTTVLYLRSGTCCVVKVGKVSMDKEEIVENVVRVVEKGVEMVVERGWEGVRSLHLKFSDSVALPVYQAMPDVRLKSEETETETGEEKKGKGKVSDSEGEGKESGGKRVGKKKSKGRIHEVKYMDVDLDDDEVVKGVEEVVGDAGIDEVLKVEKSVGKKRKVSEEKKGKGKKKAKVDNKIAEEETPKENDGVESVGEKKRKKKSDGGVVKKSKKADGNEKSGEIKFEEKSEDEVVAKKSKKIDATSKEGESGEVKPKKKSDKGVTKKSKKTDEVESAEMKPKKKSEKGVAKKTDVVESAEKKGKKKAETEKKVKGVAKVKDGKQKKRVSFE